MIIKVYQEFLNEVIEKVENETDNELHKLLKLKSITVANTPIYASLAYFITNSKEEMYRIHDVILDAVCYIGCIDILIETNNDVIKAEMEFFEKRLMNTLTKDQSNTFKVYLNEIIQKGTGLHGILKKRLYEGEYISEADIKEATLVKSSDIKVYFKLLSLLLNDDYGVPQYVIDEIYLKQIKQDFLDDFEDLEEDFKSKEVSPLLIRMVKTLGMEFIKNSNKQALQKASEDYGIFKQQEACIHQIALEMQVLPDNYQWIRNIYLQPEIKDYDTLTNKVLADITLLQKRKLGKDLVGGRRKRRS